VNIVLISVAAIGFAMLIMAVGVIVQNKRLRGSCGGSEIFDCDGEAISCGACPNRQKRREERKHLPGGAFRELAGIDRK